MKLVFKKAENTAMNLRSLVQISILTLLATAGLSVVPAQAQLPGPNVCSPDPEPSCETLNPKIKACKQKIALKAGTKTRLEEEISLSEYQILRKYLDDVGENNVSSIISAIKVSFDNFKQDLKGTGISVDATNLGKFAGSAAIIKELENNPPADESGLKTQLKTIAEIIRNIGRKDKHSDISSEKFFDDELKCIVERARRVEIFNGLSSRKNICSQISKVQEFDSDEIDRSCREKIENVGGDGELIVHNRLEQMKFDPRNGEFQCNVSEIRNLRHIPKYQDIFGEDAKSEYGKLTILAGFLNGKKQSCPDGDSMCSESNKILEAVTSKRGKLGDTLLEVARLTAVKTELEGAKGSLECPVVEDNNANDNGTKDKTGIQIVNVTYKPNWRKGRYVPPSCMCDATPEFKLTCQSFVQEVTYCFERNSVGLPGELKVDPAFCDESKKDKIYGGEGGITRDKRIEFGSMEKGNLKRVCYMGEISHRKLCGGLNPAPFEEKKAVIQYNCHGEKVPRLVDGKEVQALKVDGMFEARDKMSAMLSCPVPPSHKKMADDFNANEKRKLEKLASKGS